MTAFQFACPRCYATLTAVSPHTYTCPQDNLSYEQVEGIWRFLLPERAERFAQFVKQYETVRQAEGWGGLGQDYYQALPFVDLSGRFRRLWQIRAKSFTTLVEQVLPQQTCRIVDVGAGNAWLSYRLTQHGHEVMAVDLLTNVDDGLGAHIFYDVSFTVVQAEFNRLPLTNGQADMIIFNGSLHYTTNYIRTLSEALRLLTPQGQIVIMDTPIYHQAQSGQQMVQEREALFKEEYGFTEDALPHEGFLTFARLEETADMLGLTWQTIRPEYDWRWRIRPWLARVRRHREPATFLIFVGQRT